MTRPRPDGPVGTNAQPDDLAEDLALWTDALDLFEQRVEAFGSVLTVGGTPPTGVWPPSELVGRPLPPELADRVRMLLARSNEVEAQIRARQQELPAIPKAHPRHRRQRRSSIEAFL